MCGIDLNLNESTIHIVHALLSNMGNLTFAAYSNLYLNE